MEFKSDPFVEILLEPDAYIALGAALEMTVGDNLRAVLLDASRRRDEFVAMRQKRGLTLVPDPTP